MGILKNQEFYANLKILSQHAPVTISPKNVTKRKTRHFGTWPAFCCKTVFYNLFWGILS
jgi:hypothetical protein